VRHEQGHGLAGLAQKAVTAQIAASLTPSACKLHNQSGRSCGYAGHSIDIDCMWPAILWQMEPRIAADQGNVASAGAVDIARFATGHEGLRSNYIWRLTDAAERKLG